MANQPGRLGDPAMTFVTDPRADRRIVQLVEMMGGFTDSVPVPPPGTGYDELVAYCGELEAANAAGNDMLRAALPTWDNVESSTQVIRGVDGNDITLFIHKPKDVVGPVPCLYHTHGGGMVIMSADDPGFIRLRNDIASRGLVVVGVEFRNGGGRLGPHPFPAGLNDCTSGLQWVNDNKAALGISNIVISGESGGGNLALATTLKAKREGRLSQVDGVYALCPYISGAYGNPPEELASLQENDGYLLGSDSMAHMVTVYDPKAKHANNPLAWPLHAEVSELVGLPPVAIGVNELDPLRDEGLAFYRKLLAANVPCMARTAHGTPHAGDQMFADAVPQAYQDLLDSIVGFARSV